jgi:hypothetical protein
MIETLKWAESYVLQNGRFMIRVKKHIGKRKLKIETNRKQSLFNFKWSDPDTVRAIGEMFVAAAELFDSENDGSSTIPAKPSE